MTVVTSSVGYVDRPRSSDLAEVVDLILDKGLVIDVFLRVSLLGLELLTVDARIVVAGVDTYLRFAEAADRVILGRASTTKIQDLLGEGVEGGARRKVRGAGRGVAESVKDTLGIGEDESTEDEGDDEPQPSSRDRSGDRG